MSRNRKIAVALFGLMVAGFLVIQILPVGWIRPWLVRNENPPVLTTINWDSPETERLTRTACFDCHSNETVWPWYSYIAPASWLVLRDVNQGRAALNFSEEGPEDFDMDDFEWHIYNDMPKWIYLVMHPEAEYPDEVKAQLIAGLRATFGLSSDGESDMEGMEMD
jgi:hypothetical protein